MKPWIDSQWRRVPPIYQRGLMMALVAIGVFGMIYIFVSNTPKKRAPQPKKITRSIFGQKEKQLNHGLAQVSSQIEQMEKKNKELQQKVELLTREKEKPVQHETQMKLEVARQVQQELAKIKPEPEKKAESQKKISGQIKETKKGEPSSKFASSSSGRKEKGQEQAAKRPVSQLGGPAASEAKKIRIITASAENNKDKIEKKTEIETFLPAGSIFSGTLLTGLDVSCGKSSKKDPFPVLLRVKKEAILPNRYRADVRECFLLAAGWGDLGSERAYLRGERLSCIREDGKALETKVEMFAVGEDGKAGVRGRLVSKAGALMSKALLAGFMQGFSQIFTKQPVLTIATGKPGQTTPFQSTLSKDALESAGLEGAGSALERLAKYYIDMAKDIFPVIEVDAGRAIDFVLISGKNLKLQSRKTKDS